jgi:putative salt-induced outer membrane protein YdiY
MVKTQTYRFKGLSLGKAAAIVAGTLWLGAQGAFAQAPAPAPAKEPPKPKGWESSAAAGLTLTKGNSENFLATLTLNTSRKWERDEVLLGAGAGYGENKKVDFGSPNNGEKSKTQDYLMGFGQYNHLFTERLYGGVRLDGLHDSISGIEYRFSLSPILGYYFVKAARTTLAGEAGPTFIYENRGGDKKGYMGLRFAERFEHKFNDRARMWQSAEYIPQVDDFNNYLVNFELGASTKITQSIGLRVVLQDNYVNKPAPHRRTNDLKLVAGVDYTF